MIKSQRHFQQAFVPVQLHHIACSFEHRGAALAFLEVLLHGRPQTGIEIIIEKIRDFAPHLFAVDYHGFVPFLNDTFRFHAPSKPGASMSRSMSRALSNRVFTAATEIPSACAVSSMLK